MKKLKKEDGYGRRLLERIAGLAVGEYFEIEPASRNYSAKCISMYTWPTSGASWDKGRKKFKVETHRARPFGRVRVFVARHQ